MEYIRKNSTVQAILWTGNNIGEVEYFLEESMHHKFQWAAEDIMHIVTDGNWLTRIVPNTFLVLFPGDVFIPMSADQFLATFEVKTKASVSSPISWISVDDDLPEHNEYVLADFPDRPWIDVGSTGGINCVVVKFVRGLSLEDRRKLDDSNPRKLLEKPEDEGVGNNKRPYYWTTFGPGEFFGQDAKRWARLK